jgi:hypothetical protein
MPTYLTIDGEAGRPVTLLVDIQNLMNLPGGDANNNHRIS